MEELLWLICGFPIASVVVYLILAGLFPNANINMFEIDE